MYRKHDDNTYLIGSLGLSNILSVRYVAQFLHNANDFYFEIVKIIFFKYLTAESFITCSNKILK